MSRFGNYKHALEEHAKKMSFEEMDKIPVVCEMKTLKGYNPDGFIKVGVTIFDKFTEGIVCHEFQVVDSNCKDVLVNVCVQSKDYYELTIRENTNSVPRDLINGDWFCLKVVGDWFESDITKFVVNIRFYQRIIYRIKKIARNLKIRFRNFEY